MEKLARREEAVQRKLRVVIEKYAEALELYDAWKADGIVEKPKLDAKLRDMSINDKLAELRRQIEMRTVALGWTQFAVPLSFDKDEKEAIVKAWRKLLLDDIIPHEIGLRRQRQLPKAA
eukprot:2346121-Prymnesium_polylepis.1